MAHHTNGSVCHIQWFGVPHTMVRCATYNGSVCHIQWFGVPHTMVRCATYNGLVCHMQWFGVPHTMVWCATYNGLVCHIQWFGVPHAVIGCVQGVCKCPRDSSLATKGWSGTALSGPTDSTLVCILYSAVFIVYSICKAFHSFQLYEWP